MASSGRTSSQRGASTSGRWGHGVRWEAERQRPALVIVDPLLRFVRLRAAGDYAAVTTALEPLLALARDTGAHVLAVHHLGKAERSGGDGILGSTSGRSPRSSATARTSSR